MSKKIAKSFSHNIILRITIIVMLLGDGVLAKAQNINAFNGTYSGTATQIIVNGSAKTPQHMSFVLKNGVLIGNVPKIGRMPGRIYFNIAPIRLQGNGAIYTSAKNAGKIRMFGLFSSTLVWDGTTGDKQGYFHGTLRQVNGKPSLNLTLHVYTSMMGKKVKATVVFKGVRR